MRAVALSLAAVLAAGPALAAEPLRVFFTVAAAPAAAGDVKAKAEALKRDRDAAWAEYEAFDKQLKKENGKKYEKWPPEVKEKADLSYEKYVGKALDYLLFTIKPQDLSFYNLQMNYVVEPGEFEIMLGTSSEDGKTVTLNVTE